MKAETSAGRPVLDRMKHRGSPLPDWDGPCTGFVEGTRQADPFLIRHRGDSGRGIYFVF